MLLGFLRSWSIFLGLMLLTPLSHAASQQIEKTTKHSLRVVTLFQGATDSAVALGVIPVGVVDAWGQSGNTYDYLKPALQGVAHVGLETQPNLEAIMALKPDLIIATRFRHEKIYPLLSKIAPTVMANNIYDFKATLALTAKALHKEAEGKKVWQAFQQRAQTLHTELKATQGQWPLTVSIINVRADHLRLYLKNSFPGSVLKEIGYHFLMPDNHGWGVKIKSKEALPRLNADVFFVILQSNDPAVIKNYANWQHHPLWKMLNAPKHQQVYQVDRVAWSFSGGILGANRMLDELYALYHLPKP